MSGSADLAPPAGPWYGLGMIAGITGQLDALEGSTAIVRPESGGLSYAVLVPAYLARELESRTSQEITLHTLTIIESHGQGTTMTPRLLGFATIQDRRFFELFTTVKGLGNRKALRALAEPPSRVATMIHARDAKALRGLPEIGARLADTIILELVEKVVGYLGQDSGAGPSGARHSEPKPIATGPEAEAIAALVSLGETPERAEMLVGRAMRGIEHGATAERIIAAAFTSGS